MYVFILLLIVAGGKSEKSNTHLYLYPETIGSWKASDVSTLRCPPVKNREELEKLKPTEVIFKMQEEHYELNKVEGIICYGLQYNTKCEEGFFGQTSITRSIIQTSVDEIECKKTIFKKTSGQYIEPYFLAQSCEWMSTKEIGQDFLIIESHSVEFDPYTLSYVDALFEGGICKSQVCPTIHSNSLWMTDHQPIQSCSDFHLHAGTIYSDDSGEGKYLEYLVSEIVPLTDHCKLTYCNKTGVRLSNGIFLSFDLGMPFESKAEDCPPNAEIAYYQMADYLMSLEQDWSMRRYLSDCLTTLIRTRNQKEISFQELSFMDPLNEGKYKIYRLNNGRLEENWAIWKGLQRFNFSMNNSIGVTSSDSYFTWTDWVKSGTNGLLSGYNGVHKIEETGQIIIPQIELIKQRYSETLLTSHPLKRIHHPIVKHIERSSEMLEEMRTSSENSVDFSGWITKVWDNFWGKISLIISIIIGLVSLVCIIKCIMKCKQHKKRSKSDKRKLGGEADTELRTIVNLFHPQIRESKEPERFSLQVPRGWGSAV